MRTVAEVTEGNWIGEQGGAPWSSWRAFERVEESAEGSSVALSRAISEGVVRQAW